MSSSITYELASELKKAGFPHVDDHGCTECGISSPTLEELIAACGGVLVWGCKPHGYFASKQFCPVEHPTGAEPVIEADAKGDTPIEAVARLWLALNKK